MLNGLKIEHLCDIIPKAQIWLVLNLPVFMFVYSHFDVPLPERQIWLEMYQMKTFTDFAFFSLVCVQSVIQLMDTRFLTFDKRVPFLFKSDCCPRLWNGNFLCYLYTSRPSLLFSVE